MAASCRRLWVELWTIFCHYRLFCSCSNSCFKFKHGDYVKPLSCSAFGLLCWLLCHYMHWAKDKITFKHEQQCSTWIESTSAMGKQAQWRPLIFKWWGTLHIVWLQKAAFYYTVKKDTTHRYCMCAHHLQGSPWLLGVVVDFSMDGLSPLKWVWEEQHSHTAVFPHFLQIILLWWCLKKGITKCEPKIPSCHK